MKKFLLSTLVFGLAFSACKKDDSKDELPLTPQPQVAVAKINNSLLQKIGATKSVPCGSWGWTVADELSAYASGKAYILHMYPQNIHAEGFVSQAATDMFTAWASPDYPSCAVNGQPKLDRGTTVNIESEKKMCRDAMDAHKGASVIANLGIQKSIEAGKITIKTSTMFFEASTGDYHLAVYISEEGAMWKQSGHATGASTVIPHPHVMRAAVNGTWGELIMSGSIAAGSFKDKSFTYSLDPSWNAANIEVVAVLWKKNSNGKYDFVNANGIQK